MIRRHDGDDAREENFGGKQRTAGFVVIAFGALFASLTGAFFITSYLYRVFDYYPQGLFEQLITFAVGLLIMAIAGRIMGKFSVSKRIFLWQSIITALKQMSKGNFNIKIELQSSVRSEGRVRELIYNINHMADELGQLEQIRQEFISNVSHEIQSPLTSITGFVQALKSDNLPNEKRLHYLDIIETESSRLSKLSNNLMKLTTLESNQHPFPPNPFRLDTQLRNVVLSVEPQWMKKEIHLDISLEHMTIIAVEDLLSQVWWNLLNNAIKFTPEQGTVRITLKSLNGNAVVSITDSGIGISDTDQERIFERFYKVDKSRNRVTEGSGLGLAIVKKILDMHQGTIKVESKPTLGTTFIVQLPLQYQPTEVNG